MYMSTRVCVRLNAGEKKRPRLHYLGPIRITRGYFFFLFFLITVVFEEGKQANPLLAFIDFFFLLPLGLLVQIDYQSKMVSVLFLRGIGKRRYHDMDSFSLSLAFFFSRLSFLL